MRVIFFQTSWARGRIEEPSHPVGHAVNFEHVSSLASLAAHGFAAEHARKNWATSRESTICLKSTCRKESLFIQGRQDSLMRLQHHKVIAPLQDGMFPSSSGQSFPERAMIMEKIPPRCKVDTWILQRGSPFQLCPHPRNIMFDQFHPGKISLEKAPRNNHVTREESAQVANACKAQEVTRRWNPGLCQDLVVGHVHPLRARKKTTNKAHERRV